MDAVDGTHLLLDVDRFEAAVLQRALSSEGLPHGELQLGLGDQRFPEDAEIQAAREVRERLNRGLRGSEGPEQEGTVAILHLDPDEAALVQRVLARIEDALGEDLDSVEASGRLMRRAIAAGKAKRLRLRIDEGRERSQG